MTLPLVLRGMAAEIPVGTRFLLVGRFPQIRWGDTFRHLAMEGDAMAVQREVGEKRGSCRRRRGADDAHPLPLGRD